MITLFCMIVFDKLPRDVMPLWVYLVLLFMEFLFVLKLWEEHYKTQ